MTTYTPNFRLAMPPFDDMPWDQAVNGNMQIIDSVLAQYSAIPNFRGMWANSTLYSVGEKTLDSATGVIWQAAVTHTSAVAPTTFTQDRAANPSYWGVSSGSAMTVGDTAPIAPTNGDLWFSTTDAQLYVFYSETTSSQWVVATNEQGIIGEAPNDGNTYARQNSAWTVTNAVANVGRNLIHNPLFNIAQRGAGPFTTGYTQDRWSLGVTTDIVSVITAIIGDAGRTQIGDEEAIQCLANTFTGNAAAGAFNLVSQQIESLRRLAGKTVTVSFWAVANSGTPKLGVSIDQLFGTGGSPSAAVLGNGLAVTVSTTWTRYTLTFGIPTIIGKTLGTNNDHSTSLRFWFSSGATNAVRSGNVGVQSNGISIWGVQLEVGSIATPLEKPDPQQDLAKCQRFYQTGSAQIAAYNTTGAGISYNVPFRVTMRGTPTMAVSAPSVINTGTPTAPSAGTNEFQFQALVTLTGAAFAAANWTASADL